MKLDINNIYIEMYKYVQNKSLRKKKTYYCAFD